MLKLRAFIVFALVLAGLQVRNASAVSVYDNFGPGDTYDTGAGWPVVGPTNGFTLEAAMRFAPSGNYSFVAADLAAGLVSGTNSITVTLASDNSGAPGAAIETFQLNNDMGTFGVANAPLEADSVTHPILDSGVTYWLVASATGDTYAIWNDSLSDTSGGSGNAGTGWSFQSGNPTAAFSITGAALTPVPEPGSIALFGTGMLAAIGFHLARKRRSAKLSG
jgi:hypothetical protein